LVPEVITNYELRITNGETADDRPRTTDDRPLTTDHRPLVADDRPLTTDHGKEPRTEQAPVVRRPSSVVEEQPRPIAGKSALTVAAVAGMWPEMTKQVGRRNKNLPALLSMCKPLALEGNTIILGFDYPLLKDKFDKTAGALDLVTATFRALGAADCLVRTVTTSDYPVPIAREEFQALASELGGVVKNE